MFDDLQRELSRLWSSLGAAVERAGRELGREASRRVARIPKVGPLPARLPSPHVRRPVPHPLALPRRFRGGMPRTLLDRQRMFAARRPAVARPPGASVKASAERLADVLRRRLLDLQTALRSLQQRIGNREGNR